VVGANRLCLGFKCASLMTRAPVQTLGIHACISRCGAGGSPRASLAILANELCVERGGRLEAGTRVICGHCCQAELVGRPSPPLGGARRPESGLAHWSSVCVRACCALRDSYCLQTAWGSGAGRGVEEGVGAVRRPGVADRLTCMGRWLGVGNDVARGL
jgi:putative hemolysin